MALSLRGSWRIRVVLIAPHTPPQTSKHVVSTNNSLGQCGMPLCIQDGCCQLYWPPGWPSSSILCCGRLVNGAASFTLPLNPPTTRLPGTSFGRSWYNGPSAKITKLLYDTAFTNTWKGLNICVRYGLNGNIKHKWGKFIKRLSKVYAELWQSVLFFSGATYVNIGLCQSPTNQSNTHQTMFVAYQPMR